MHDTSNNNNDSDKDTLIRNIDNRNPDIDKKSDFRHLQFTCLPHSRQKVEIIEQEVGEGHREQEEYINGEEVDNSEVTNEEETNQHARNASDSVPGMATTSIRSKEEHQTASESTPSKIALGRHWHQKQHRHWPNWRHHDRDQNWKSASRSTSTSTMELELTNSNTITHLSKLPMGSSLPTSMSSSSLTTSSAQD